MFETLICENFEKHLGL